MNEEYSSLASEVDRLRNLVYSLNADPARNLRYGQPVVTSAKTSFVPIAGIAGAGTPVFERVVGNGYFAAWKLDSAALVETVILNALVPLNFESGLGLKIYWTNLVAGAGNVRIQAQIIWAGQGENIDAPAHSSNEVTTEAAPSQYVVETWIPGFTIEPNPGDILQIHLSRAGSHGDDTLAGDMGIIAVELTYTGT